MRHMGKDRWNRWGMLGIPIAVLPLIALAGWGVDALGVLDDGTVAVSGPVAWMRMLLAGGFFGWPFTLTLNVLLVYSDLVAFWTRRDRGSRVLSALRLAACSILLWGVLLWWLWVITKEMWWLNAHSAAVLLQIGLHVVVFLAGCVQDWVQAYRPILRERVPVGRQWGWLGLTLPVTLLLVAAIGWWLHGVSAADSSTWAIWPWIFLAIQSSWFFYLWWFLVCIRNDVRIGRRALRTGSRGLWVLRLIVVSAMFWNGLFAVVAECRLLWNWRVFDDGLLAAAAMAAFLLHLVLRVADWLIRGAYGLLHRRHARKDGREEEWQV